jgi:hypothetical protein
MGLNDITLVLRSTSLLGEGQWHGQKNALLSYKKILLRVRYNAGKLNNNSVEEEYPAVDELRPL